MTTRGYFITGTDTEIGKTLTACILIHTLRAQGLRTVGMKPIAAGAIMQAGERINEDVAMLQAASSPADPALVNPYLFDPPIAPHIAAAQAGIEIDLAHIQHCYQQLAATHDAVVIEGVGGFCVPLGAHTDTAQLAQPLALPVILVVGMRLGCINHALLTAQAIRAHGLTLHGWVANRIDPAMACVDENLDTLKARLGAPLLGVVPHLTKPDPPAAAGYLSLT